MDSSEPSSGSGSHDQKHQHAMENFKELLMKCVIKSTPNKSLTPPQKSLVDQRLQESFPHFHAPDHHPYSWMIQNAIEELNEEGGSNEEAISQFIVRRHNDLPWAHTTLLEHHLKKLCESGELVENHDKYYLLGGGKANLNPISSPCSSFNSGASTNPTPDLIPIPEPSSRGSPIHSPSYIPSSSPSSSPSLSSCPSDSNGCRYNSSLTSSSDSSFSLKRNRQERKRGSQWNRGAKGIKVRSSCTRIQDKGRGRGRGRGQGRRRGLGRGCCQLSMENMMEEEIENCGKGRRLQAKGRGRGRSRGQVRGQLSMENMMEEETEECGQERVQAKSRGRGRGRMNMENMMEEEIEDYVHQIGPHKDRRMEQDIEMNVDHHLEATEKQDITIEIAAAEKHVRLEEQNQVQGNPDLNNVAEPSDMVIEIEPRERENRINDERIELERQGKVCVQMEETKQKWNKRKQQN